MESLVREKNQPVGENMNDEDDIDYLSEEMDDAFSDEDESRNKANISDADPIASPNTVSAKPGPLKTKGSICLHTRAAHKLFYGRKKDTEAKVAQIIGLLRFASNVNNLYDLASKDDPYADMKLLEIETKFNQTTEFINSSIESLKDLLDGLEGVNIGNPESVKPVHLPIEFKTTYGFLAARILAKYDELVRLAQSAKHVGVIFSDDWGKLVGGAGRKIRDAFWTSNTYRFMGVNRDDLAANNKVALRAIEKYGELPESIKDGSQRGRYAPEIIKLRK